jgi:hypothetical protein
LAFHVSDHFSGRVEGPEGSTLLEIFLGFGETRVYRSALCRGILIIRAGELGTINYQRRAKDNSSAMDRSFKPIPLPNANCGAESAWQSHLALALNLDENAHVTNRQEVGNPVLLNKV